jgi:beta-lactamase regulating signal transducer with metallopeptidase domain
MAAPLLVVLTNAAAALLIALFAWAVSRVVRRPALVHGLWLVALVKLVAPPLVPLPLLPDWRMDLPGVAPDRPILVRIEPPEPAEASPRRLPLQAVPSAEPGATPVSDIGVLALTDPPAPAPLPKAPIDPTPVAALVFTAGALGVGALAVLRFLRFRRLLRYASPAPPALSARVAALALRMGLRRAPPLRLVPARVPPMLWPTAGGPELLLPASLLPEVADDERDALLVHELAHVRRRDHWVRLVELAATSLFWWYPVAWWVRSSLRRAEERCCDEWVLRVLPGSGRAYVNGLLKSLTFVAGEPCALPVIASGAMPIHDLEARLKEILMTRPASRLAVPVRLALATATALGLAVFPTRAQERAHAGERLPVATVEEASPLPAVAPAPPASPAIPDAAPAPAARPAVAVAGRPAPPPAVPATPVVAAAEAPPAPPSQPIAEETPAPTRRALEEQLRSLEARRVHLQKQQLELTRQRVELETRARQEELRKEAARLRSEGEAERAALLEQQAQIAARRADIERRQLELEGEQMALEARLEATAREKAERPVAHDLEQGARQLEKLSADEQVQALREATLEISRSLAAQIDALRRSLDRLGPQRSELEPELRRLEKALSALRDNARP